VKDASANFATAQTLGTLNVHVPYAGDANGDNTVDFLDLALMAQSYNTYGKGQPNGDVNFDGIVDFLDLALLAQHYNTSLPPPVFASAPAPAAPAVSATLAPVAAAPIPKSAKPKPVAKKVNPIFATAPIRPPAAVNHAKPRDRDRDRVTA
jgi:hypothetical protein